MSVEQNKNLLVREYERLAAKKRIVDSCPYFHYEPWGDQISFEQSPAQIRLLVGGNRSGKSTEGIAEDIAHAVGFRHDGSKLNLPSGKTHGLILVKDRRKAVDKVVMQKINSFVAHGWVEHVKPGQDGFPEILTFRNGSKIYIGSYYQEAGAQEGLDWDWVHFDEPPPRPIWIAVRRGLIDRGGRAWFTLTPLNCPWIYNELYLKSDGLRISVHTITLLDNPHLKQSEKEAFIADLHPDEIEARVYGKFSHLLGSIFPEFRRDVHVVPAHSPPPGCPIFMVMDPHDRRPSYILWCYVDARDRIVIFDEWPNENFWEMKTVHMSVRDYSNVVRDKEGVLSKRVFERIMDPNFGKTPSHMTGRTLEEEYLEYGLDFYTDINNSIMLGHNRIHDRLEYKKRDPSILVCENCTNMIWAFESYVWKTKDLEAEFNAKERPEESGKDQIDALRYLLDYDPLHSMGDSIGADEPYVTMDDEAGYA
jgi:hypothetical protein